MGVAGKGVIIVGAPRSGTSSVAAAFARLGFYFGKKEDLYKGDLHNPGGYWEHRRINGLHRRFLMSLNLRSVGLDPMQNDWIERPASKDFVLKGARLLEGLYGGHTLWGWKDPQAASLLPFVRAYFEEAGTSPRVVICVRNPLDVGASQLARKGAPINHTLGEWLLSTICSLRQSAGLGRTLIVYGSLLQSPESVLRNAVEALNLGDISVGVKPIHGAIDRSLNHGEETEDALCDQPALIKAVYQLCLEIELDPGGFGIGKFENAIEALWLEYLRWHGMFSRPAVAEAKVNLSWVRAEEVDQSDTTFRPSGSWQVITLQTRALPATSVVVNLFPLPAVVWLRRAVWRHALRESIATIRAGRHGVLERKFGLERVWLLGNPEHLLIDTPNGKGPFELELEMLVESSNVITASITDALNDKISETSALG